MKSVANRTGRGSIRVMSLIAGGLFVGGLLPLSATAGGPPPAESKPSETKHTEAKQTETKPADPREQGVLKVGDKAPNASVTAPDGKTVNLADLYKDGPVIITFYRGGWCPYCNVDLKGWETRQADVKAAGATFVAISPEKPEKVAETKAKDATSFPMMSDSTLAAAKAFRVDFALDDKTQTAYKGYGIDLASTNSTGTWELPMPATFVVDKEGVIRYAFAKMDYKVRANPDTVLGAVKAITQKN